jgi:hypothetical protein
LKVAVPNNVIIIKTEVLLPQAQGTLSDFWIIYQYLGPLIFFLTKTLKLFGFPIF